MGHGDRLSAVDAAFLEMETPTQHMHVGGLFLFEPGPDSTFTFDRFQRLVRSRLHLVPRYRQTIAWTPLGLAQPIWVDDPAFDLAYHVRHAALPRPGGIDQLLEYAGRILSRPLDRSKPLWEAYVVEGLEDGRIALVTKNHHAMIDGVAGVDIVGVLLDDDPVTPAELPRPQAWEPRRAPGGLERTTDAVRELVRQPASVVSRARRVAERPVDVLRRTAAVGQGIASMATSGLSGGLAGKSVLNQAPGISRRFVVEQLDLGEIKEVKNALGGTVNDVVLAVCGDMLGRFLRARGERTAGDDLRIMVPVSVRTTANHDNQVTAVFVDVPVGEMDPVERLASVTRRMGDVKSTHQAVGADFLLSMTGFAPPTIHAAAARVASGARLFNVVITNVPGPQHPIYALGARLVGGFPFVPLAATQSLAIGLVSLDGIVNVGFTADYDALPDVSAMPEMVRASLEDLVACARAVGR
ncbi:WS/DGAT/MGAT family O-acyltransferase [Salsipaludibacter albus]|uniref:WS/DGAT/MGAT family O-acyltransferase n=1 Tax=Salsipaludibacter albus TaxID=2849650 RepID=UPI001EE46496|nr:wax ester/triacylglycerol synthase family O-acyltransferase [Salsipaludibacter albus]MBY5163556.1 wax ester/triacylglycerol synthase family O-acyltransferase [Salsipaludibacter albus]